MKKVFFLLTCLSVWFEVSAQQPAKRPNIIVILSDDMGYSDLGCYGSEIHTPNLDKLYKNGLRFTQFYNTARCCPSRASLLTGLYPHQAGMGWMRDKDAGLEGYQGGLSKHAVTMAEVVKPAGYTTLMVGKWHVSQGIRQDGPLDNWPLQRGFDRFYGTIQGAGSYYDPATLCRGNQLITPATDTAYQPANYFYTDAVTHEAIRFIKESDPSKPFFMYLAYTAAHWPLQAKPADIKKYKGMYDKGWAAIRKQRFEKMKKLGLLPANAELSPSDAPDWKDEKNKAVQAGRMEVYAAMVDEMDQGIGEIMAQLKKQGLDENTVVMFMQDNGGCAEEIGTKGKTGPMGANPEKIKPRAKDEIEYDVIPKMTRDGKLIMKGEGIIGGPETTYVSYGKVWANVSNTPFREYKHWVHEGGISTPLIIHYPAGIRQHNSSNFVGHFIDIMPTVAELAGASYPANWHNSEIIPMEGISLVPLFTGKALDRGKALCWEHEMNRAVRLGDWKLVSKGELLSEKDGYGEWKNYELGKWELYNIKSDRSELHDVSAQHPDMVKEMSAIWDDYAKRAKVLPAPWTPLQGTPESGQ